MTEFATADGTRTVSADRTLDLILTVGYDIKVHSATSQRPAYVHSVGLTLLSLPELIVFGLESDPACRLLGRFCQQSQGRPLMAGFYENVLDRKLVALINVPAGRAGGFIRLPTRLFTPEQLTGGLQVVWPDHAGRYPWQPKCAISAGAQPMLGSPPPTEPPLICGGVIDV